LAKISRKELKTDRFALEVGHTFDYVEEHKRQILKYAGLAAAVLAALLAVFFYMRHRESVRQQDLAQAIRALHAPVGEAGNPDSFPTPDAKNKAAAAALNSVIAKYPSSDEAMIARFGLASQAVDVGNLAEAEKLFKQVADSGIERFAPLAQLSLGEICFATGRPAEGEKILRGLIERPSIFVSSEEATVALARQLASTKPTEARKLLEGVASKTSSPTVSRTVVGLIGELFNQ